MGATDGEPNLRDRLLVKQADLCTLLSYSRRKVAQMIRAGEIPEPVIGGSRPRWSIDELRHWVAAGCPTSRQWRDVKHVRFANNGSRLQKA